MRIVARSKSGQKIGEYHHLAKITDHDVDLIIELKHKYNLSYAEIRDKFDCVISISQIAKLCRYERRNVTVEKWSKE